MHNSDSFNKLCMWFIDHIHHLLNESKKYICRGVRGLVWVGFSQTQVR